MMSVFVVAASTHSRIGGRFVPGLIGSTRSPHAA
jgi:hypothetical protein